MSLTAQHVATDNTIHVLVKVDSNDELGLGQRYVKLKLSKVCKVIESCGVSVVEV